MNTSMHLILKVAVALGLLSIAKSAWCQRKGESASDPSASMEFIRKVIDFERAAFFRLGLDEALAGTAGIDLEDGDEADTPFPMHDYRLSRPRRHLTADARQALAGEISGLVGSALLAPEPWRSPRSLTALLVAYSELHEPLFLAELQTAKPTEVIFKSVEPAKGDREDSEEGARVENPDLAARLFAMAFELATESERVLHFDRDPDFPQPGVRSGLEGWPVTPDLATLSLFREPSLKNEERPRFVPSVRFLWIRTFGKPVAIRAFQTSDGGKKLRSVVMSGKGGYRWGKIMIDRTRDLKEAEWAALMERIDRPGAVTPLEALIPEQREIVDMAFRHIMDSDSWSLEVLTERGYEAEVLDSPDLVEAVRRNNPDFESPWGFLLPSLANFVALGDFLLELAHLENDVLKEPEP